MGTFLLAIARQNTSQAEFCSRVPIHNTQHVLGMCGDETDMHGEPCKPLSQCSKTLVFFKHAFFSMFPRKALSPTVTSFSVVPVHLFGR
jgi:hypothetical protein